MKRQGIKRFLLLGIPFLLLLGYFVFVFFQIRQEERQAKAEGLTVVMTNPQFNFVSKEEIRKIAKKQFGDIKKIKHDSINRNKLELAIKKNPFVEDAQVFRTASNAYCVEITQRSPMLRVWTEEILDYVTVDSKEELTLYLRVKSGAIYLGKVDGVAAKLEKLKFFMDKLGKYNGMDIYESVDLRFDNQVVVKKK